ncbi:MAG: translation elongation factor Ts [Chloroflexota bacterium]|nr:translation elongation factor Ts [Chloroflexota bacterium]
MATNIEKIKTLRQMTGGGVLDCKQALDEADGDIEEAAQILRQQGFSEAAEKADRVVEEGCVDTYIHTDSKLGSLIQVNCETDFVARTEEFRSLCHDLAMQVAATAPQWVSREDIPEEVIEEQTQKYLSEIEEDKPEHILERIVEGKLNKFCQERCLLEQPFIRDDEKTIQQLITEMIAETGENIVIKRFARFNIE